jgi:hypothetical protein
MDILKKHTKSTIFLGIYALWWAFVLYYCFCTAKNIKPTCDFSPIAFVFVSFILGLIYSIGFLIKSLTVGEPEKTDYLIFLGMIMLPLIIGGFYVMSYS